MKNIVFRPLSYLAMAISLISCQKKETTQPRQADIVDAVFASGKVISEQEYLVTANTEGYLVTSFVDVGTMVSAGMSLFQLSNDVQSRQLSNAQVNYQDAIDKLDKNSPERQQLELQIAQAESQLELDKKNFERYEKLLSSKAVSQLDFDNMRLQYENSRNNLAIQQKALDDLINSLKLNAENAELQLIIQKENNEDYFLKSSAAGLVLQVFKEPGELVKRGEAVAKIGGGKKLAKLFVAEEDINEINIRQEVIINLNTEKNQYYEGLISRIYPSFDEQEQSFIVEAVFTKEPTRLYHNTQLQANIIINQKKDALVIPVQYLEDGDSVITKSNGQQFVQVGLRNEQWVEVVEGLHSEEVLIKPSNL